VFKSHFKQGLGSLRSYLSFFAGFQFTFVGGQNEFTSASQNFNSRLDISPGRLPPVAVMVQANNRRIYRQSREYAQLERGNSPAGQDFGNWVVQTAKGLVKDAYVRDNNKLGVVITPR